ncbi:MAG: hypothetical protein GY850_44705 [bacterium]|nr:hypothetical protein [bacterium]
MEIRPFDSDYRQLRRMIQRAWAREHESHIDFTETYLQFLIESPDTESILTLGAYQRGTLVSFILSKKKRIIIHGKEYLGLQQTLGTTHPDYAHLFPYLKLKSSSIKTAVDQGYDLNFGFAARGIKNNHIEPLYAEKKGFHCSRVHSFGWFGYTPADSGADWSGMEKSSVQLQPFKPSDAKSCLNIMNQAACRCVIFQKWDKHTFESRFFPSIYCEGKVVRINGKRKGFIGFSKFDMIYRRLKRKICFIYHLFLERMSEPMKQAVIGSIIAEMRQAGVEVISVPHTGYFNGDYLKKMGFKDVPFQKYKTNLYLTMFKNSLSFAPDEPFYLEIV